MANRNSYNPTLVLNDWGFSSFSSSASMSAPYRSREGLTTRSGAFGGSSGEIHLRIDPMYSDVDEGVTGLRTQVRRIKDVALEIGTEAKYQNDFVNQLQMNLIKAQAGVKNNMRRLNKRIIREGSSHVMHVVLFALLCFFIVYLWSKFSGR